MRDGLFGFVFPPQNSQFTVLAHQLILLALLPTYYNATLASESIYDSVLKSLL